VVSIKIVRMVVRKLQQALHQPVYLL
jgi:hypothetical protein